MKFTLILPTLVALAGAMPAAPADLGTRVVACGNLPLGNATSPPLDTVDSFLGFGEYSNAALAAKAPAGFKAAFTNAKATTEALGYQTYIALSKTYDVDACAAKCRSITNCKGFNIYFERDPSQVSVFDERFGSDVLFGPHCFSFLRGVVLVLFPFVQVKIVSFLPALLSSRARLHFLDYCFILYHLELRFPARPRSKAKRETFLLTSAPLFVLQSVAKACPNPKPTYFIRCTFWSTVLQAADVKNTGSTEEEFRIVIAGSNGYNVGP